MSCKRCHACGTPVRIVLDGEEWCDTCKTYQRPAHHGWGRHHDQTELERMSCEDAETHRLNRQLSMLTRASPEMRFDLYVCERDKQDENGDGLYHLHLANLDAPALLPVLCTQLYRGAACQVVTAST